LSLRQMRYRMARLGVAPAEAAGERVSTNGDLPHSGTP
jgi:hypothetical protein